MTTITLQEAQANLSEVLLKLLPGEEILITDQGQPLAKMQKAPVEATEPNAGPRKAGSAKDKILWIAPDFDAPLEDFREYME
jgi:antitoxin (DNA-binding transcriptional repressor) of toxin-antitoxin stability system